MHAAFRSLQLMDAMRILRAEGAGIGSCRGFPETVEIGVAGIIGEMACMAVLDGCVEVVLCSLSAPRSITSGSAPRDADLPRTQLELAFFRHIRIGTQTAWTGRGNQPTTPASRKPPNHVTIPHSQLCCRCNTANMRTRHQIWQPPCRDSSRRS